MDRRRFLGLFGMAGAGLAGVGAASAAAFAPAGVGRTPFTDAPGQARREQPDLPTRGTHRVIWAIEAAEPVASLTFDDGPDPEFTPAILDILRRYGVQATFFMMGWNARRNPKLAMAVVDAGHEVGNHTWTHLNPTLISPDEAVEEMHRGSREIEAVTGVRPRWFRPPRGQLSGSSIRHAAMLGTDTILWSAVPSGSAPQEVRDELVDFGPGDIVDLHDGLGRGTFNPGQGFTEKLRVRRHAEVEALPAVIEDALGRGLRLGTLSDLLAVEVPGSLPATPSPENRAAAERTPVHGERR